MTPSTLRGATAADARRLAELAARTFRDTFGAMNRPEDIEAHLEASYGIMQQAREIADPSVRTLVVEIGEEMVAFAQLRRGAVPDAIRGPNPIELQRFYVDAPWLGRGIAQQLMSAVLAEAVGLGAETLWLGVWEKNPRAIAFYRKSGFDDVGAHVFQLGSDAQTDRVMVRSLP